MPTTSKILPFQPVVSGSSTRDVAPATAKKDATRVATDTDRAAAYDGTVGKKPNASIATDASSTARRASADSHLAVRTGAATATAANHDPEVQALLDTYGMPDELGRPRDRIVKWLAKVQAGIVAADGDIDTLVTSLMQHDARRQVFLLEGVLRLYRERYPEEVGPHLKRAKELEDLLGDYSMKTGLLAKAGELNAPSKVLDHLKKEADRARADLAATVKKLWMPKDAGDRVPAIAAALKDLAAANWDDAATDRTYVLDSMRAHLKELDKTDFDMHDLVGGMHELRRQLRWVTVFTEGLDGLIQLDETRNPVAAYAGMNGDPIAASKFAVLPPPVHEAHPVQFSKSLYLANMRAVLDFGALKDEMENIEFIGKAYVDVGKADSKDEGFKKALKLLGEPKDRLHRITKESEAIYSQLRHRELFEAMRDELIG